MESKHTCPECQLVFEAPPSTNGAMNCPLCNCNFALHPVSQSIPLNPTPRLDASGRQVLRGVATMAVLALLIGGMLYAYHLIDNLGRKQVSPIAPQTHPPVIAEASPPSVESFPASPPVAIVSRPSTPTPHRERQPVVAPAESQPPLSLAQRVNRAIDNGLAALCSGHKNYNENLRYVPLLGLTLLECGVPRDDPLVRSIVASTRARERTCFQTYDLVLAILFLDRFGDSRDRKLIRTLGQRLVDGQLECGAWTYSCIINERRFRPDYGPSGIPSIPPLPSLPSRSPPRAPPGRPGRPGRPGLPGLPGFPGLTTSSGRLRISYRGDNSNTQFAILGLWVAQRHGLQARTALLATEQYFRETQHDDGSWAYHPATNTWRDSMTCAGLMSLAMRHGLTGGIRANQRMNVHDAAVVRGLNFLAQSLDNVVCADNRILGVDAREPFYFLWSLERMAVIYDLKTIGNREWYPWAAEMLVDTQRRDGVWNNAVDTCFALLILNRSNFAPDLQLAVQQPPARPKGGSMGPTIIQGRDAIEGLTTKPPLSPLPPSTTGTTTPSTKLGPSITRTPEKK